MTKQEAIKDIQDNIKPIVGGKSLDMAIEALSAQLDNNSTKVDNENVDLISRRDAIEECKLEFLNPNVERETEELTLIDQSFAKGWNRANSIWIKALKKLPSVQIDISGYSDRLWKRAYDRGYERCRQDAIDALMNDVTPYGLIDDDGNFASGCKDKDVIAMLYKLPSAEEDSAKEDEELGEWVFEERKRLDDETDDGPVYVTQKWWKCSKCGFDIGFLSSKPSDKYCPMCGDKKR